MKLNKQLIIMMMEAAASASALMIGIGWTHEGVEEGGRIHCQRLVSLTDFGQQWVSLVGQSSHLAIQLNQLWMWYFWRVRGPNVKHKHTVGYKDRSLVWLFSEYRGRGRG